MIRKLLILNLILIILFGFSIPKAKSEEINIAVYPPSFDLNLQKGQNYQNKILLRNKSDLTIPFTTKIIGFTSSDETGGISFQTDSNIEKWLKIKEPDFFLEAGDSERIEFEINIPENAPRGGYYGTVLFKSKLPSYYFKKEVAQIMPQIGTLFLISVGQKGKANFEVIEVDISEEVRITSLEGILDFLRGSSKKESIVVKEARIPFIFRIKNNDIYHIKPSGTFQILGNNNRIVGEVDVKEITILPGKIRQLSINFEPVIYNRLSNYLPESIAGFFADNLYLGKYKFVLKVHGSAEIKEEMDFWIFPLKGIIMSTLLFLFILFIFIIIKYKKREYKRAYEPKKKINQEKKKKILIDGIRK